MCAMNRFIDHRVFTPLGPSVLDSLRYSKDVFYKISNVDEIGKKGFFFLHFSESTQVLSVKSG